MAKISTIRRYKNMKTDLDSLYDDLLDELHREKELNIASNLEGKVKGTKKPFKSITAVRACMPDGLVGALRELTITITGDPNDFVVEIHAGSWLKGLGMPGKEGLIEKGPIEGASAAGETGGGAANYLLKLIKRIDEFVRKYSENPLDTDNVEVIPG